jgi:hypothetical protein
MTRSQVISDLISRYDLVVTGKDKSAIELAVFKIAVCQLVDAAFSGGGGGGGSATTPQIVGGGIDQSIDIDTIIDRLTSLDTNKLTQANIEGAIQSAADIDTIIARLTSIVTNTAGGGGGGGGGGTIIGTYTHSAPSIVDTGATALAANTSRKGAVIINRSTTGLVVDLFFGALGVYGAGLPLAPGQSYEINSTNLYSGIIRAITSTGNTAILAVAEGI